MKVNIETLQDTFKFSYNAFETSRKEGTRVMDFYHNRQYEDYQLQILERRGSPKETFNIIKTFGRLLLGYYSTVVNAIKVSAVQRDDIQTASILNDIVNYIFRKNNFLAEAEKIKLDLLLNGLMCCYIEVEETQKTDDFGRPIYDINISHVPVAEIVLDPMARLEDYSDARFIHRFKWVSEENMVKVFGKSKVSKLNPYTNHVNQQDSEFIKFYKEQFRGYSNEYNAYLLVHSIITDDNGDTYEVYWCEDEILQKSKITYKEVKNPYRLHKLNANNNTNEYYGIFREVVESQIAINQALVKIQLLVNSSQVYVEEGMVDDIEELVDAINRVNSIIQVKSLEGIKVVEMSKQVAEQYVIIDKALDRIQRVLSINDAFLGMAYAADSGTKVRIQQNASISALRYITLTIEQFYRLLGKDIINLVKQYYTATDVIRISDPEVVQRWVEINQPLKIVVDIDETGQPVYNYAWEEYRDPATGQVKVNTQGQIILVPTPTSETDIQFTEADIEVDSVAYNDEAERSRLVMEQFLSGPLGQMLSQVNPAGYFKAGSLAIKEMKTKNSDILASILEETAMMLQPGNPQMELMQNGMVAGQEKPKSTANQLTGQ